jgi:hypothetical protein
LTSVAGILALIGLYLLGVWARTYAFPADQKVDMKRLLVGALPVARLTMTAYAKTSFAALESSLVAALSAVHRDGCGGRRCDAAPVPESRSSPCVDRCRSSGGD